MRVKGDLTVLHEDDDLRIAMSGDPADPGAFICLTGVGGGVGGIQVEEFVGSTRFPGHFAIYVTDKQRSWYNFAPERLLGVIAPLIEGKEVVTIGNSMGGFGAIWLAGLLPQAMTAIAFAPQFSMHPEIMPRETRWRRYREGIAEWRVPSLAGSFDPAKLYWTFNGQDDRDHWSRFPLQPGATHFVLPDADHNIARLLKRAGVLSDVIADCLSGADPEWRIVGAGLAVARLGGVPEPVKIYA